MSTEPTLNTEIEEQLQLLAGDIFIQLEERFTQLAVKIKADADVQQSQALKQQKTELEEKFTVVHQKLSQSKHNTVNLKYSEIEQLKQKIFRYETKYDSLKEKLVKAEAAVKEQLSAKESYLEEIKLVKENRELLQSQLEPLNQRNMQLSKEKEKFSSELSELKEQHLQLQQTSEHELAQLKASLLDKSNNYQALLKERKELGKSLQQLEQKLSKTEQSLQVKSEKLDNITEENKTNIETLIKQHQERLDVYEQASGSTTNAIKAIEKQLNQAQQENAELLTENSVLSSQLTDKDSESSELLAELNTIKEKHKQAIATLAKDHKSQLTELEKSLKVKQKEIDKHLTAMERAQVKDKAQKENIAVQKKEINAFNKSISTLNKQLADIDVTHKKSLEKQEQTFKKQLANLASTNESSAEQVTNTLEQLQQAKSETTDLKAQLSNLIQTNEQHLAKIEQQHQQNVEEIHAELNAEKAKVATLNVELEQLHQSLNSEQKHQREIELAFEERLKRDTASLNEQINELSNSLEISENKRQSLVTENTIKQDKLGATNQKVVELEKLNQQINKTLSEIKAQGSAELAKTTASHKTQIQLLAKERQAETKAQNSKIKSLEAEAIQATNALNDHKERTDVIINKLNTDKDTLKALYEELKQETSGSNEEIISLKQQIEKDQMRFTGFIEKNAKLKSKQDLSDDQIRQTLKDLRDENRELKQRLSDEVAELQSSLTEYRLKFEYAQKQIALG